MNKRWKWYKRILVVTLFLNIMGIALLYYKKIENSIPNYIKLVVNEAHEFDFSYPVEADFNEEAKGVFNINNKTVNENSIKFTMEQPFTMQSSQKGDYVLNLKLFGFITFKQVHVNVTDNISLIPCGIPIGIYVETDGLLVLGTGVIPGADGLNYEPALNILQSGDYIKEVNGKAVKTIEDMQTYINEYGNNEIQLTLRRNTAKSKVRIKPVMTVEGEYKIGAWIRQDTQGIGTMTYISQDGEFGALGHGITDSDTGVLLEVDGGSIYEAEIMRIVKGEKGKPGELVGFINLTNENRIGKISNNTKLGIYGKAKIEKINMEPKDAIPVAFKQKISLGEATIRCQIEDRINEYDVEIIDIDYNNTSNKGLVLKITDPELLEKTGGIVQGMSGSPIIQKGKLIGAVTHVLVQDSTKGYGTFIENMLQSGE